MKREPDEYERESRNLPAKLTAESVKFSNENKSKSACL